MDRRREGYYSPSVPDMEDLVFPEDVLEPRLRGVSELPEHDRDRPKLEESPRVAHEVVVVGVGLLLELGTYPLPVIHVPSKNPKETFLSGVTPDDPCPHEGGSGRVMEVSSCTGSVRRVSRSRSKPSSACTW